MFTGIVEEIGTIRAIRRGANSATLEIAAQIVTQDLKIGDSVAVSGVCLTATEIAADSFLADAMPETLRRSNLGDLKIGSRVNLERALSLGSRLGGHIVSGHIDGLARLAAIRREENAIVCYLTADSGLIRYIIEKGSVTLDGTSLTVTQVDSEGFAVALIPHTAEHTTLSSRRVGDMINLECDIIGKYVERLLAPTKGGDITMDFLAENGFI